MKTRLLTLTVATLALCISMNAFGGVSVYEGFGNALNSTTLVGYSGSIAEFGLTGTWAVSGGTVTTVFPPSYGAQVGILGGHAPEKIGGNQHTVRKTGWSVANATRPLGSPIDLAVDGEWYMSFFAASSGTNMVVQAGLSNAANEVMAGNTYNWGGLTAYYGANGRPVDTNTNGTTLTGWSGNQNVFFVIHLVKSNSGTTNDLVVTVDFWYLGAGAAPTNDISRVPNRTRTINLTGVTDIFNMLKFKVDGSTNMDEIRIGKSLADVTLGYVALVAPAPDGIGGTLGDVVDAGTNLFWTNYHNWNVDVYLSGPDNDPNPAPVLTKVISSQAATSYDPPVDLQNNNWYYWRVDAREPNTVGTMQDIIHRGPLWSFKPAPQSPVITVFGNVATAMSLLPATLSATVVNPATSAIFTVDSGPAGAAVTLTPDVSNLAAPRVAVNTDMAGTYKIKLIVSNGSKSDEAIAEVVVYATACEAAKARVSGWAANYYDRDGNCIVDLNDFIVSTVEWMDDTGMIVQETYIGEVEYIPSDSIITLINPGFEQPGTGKIRNNWGLVPGWSSDTNPSDSGVEQSGAATEGVWVAFLRNSDPSVWQAADYMIAGDEVFELSFDAQNSSAFQASFYYIDGDARIPLVTRSFAVSGMNTYVLTFDVYSVPAATGKLLGVEFKNAGSGWMQFDNVLLRKK